MLFLRVFLRALRLHLNLSSFITAVVLLVTPIASGFTHSWETLFVVRIILGALSIWKIFELSF